MIRTKFSILLGYTSPKVIFSSWEVSSLLYLTALKSLKTFRESFIFPWTSFVS
ncbi:hypothetical protein DU19_0341 [Chlamydia muridarum]|nr:hypothetical protein TAC_01580 [Chlamydia muridarum str. Nigg3 CMUT3-5]AHH23617.1 hypothetical protein Y015_01580 [Chlamydia muridarum str. Nigg CM972]KDU80596.1 hypothetical protein DU17_0343 [Chlamydia muridarum]KDU81309.1 hypothetical protein DU18_0343 [Chlamydia muridarum]KDU82730.1 hypothetical protein DU19_0341 [Chlamydia muridarum]